MSENFAKEEFTVLASLCGSCGCGCPTLMESADGKSIVVVGEIDSSLLENKSVSDKVGKGETAVVIPKSVLLEAIKTMNSEI